MSTYEPGTVAVATVRGVPDIRVLRRANHWTSACLVDGYADHGDDKVTDVRRLIVLDPEDARAAEEFARDFFHDWSGCEGARGISVQNVLRGLTKPPRIPEPGLWGVVEAGSNAHPTRRKWVRYGMGWRDLTGNPQQWDDLIDPQPIRDGIEAQS